MKISIYKYSELLFISVLVYVGELKLSSEFNRPEWSGETRVNQGKAYNVRNELRFLEAIRFYIEREVLDQKYLVLKVQRDFFKSEESGWKNEGSREKRRGAEK